MKNLEEKENKKKKNKLDWINIVDNRSVIDKMTDEMLKGLYFVTLCLMLIVMVILIFVGVDAFSEIVP